MKQENIDFLEANYHHADSVRKTDTLRLLDGSTRERMMKIMAEEFQYGYATDLWCPTCVFEMIKRLYNLYDDWKAKQPKPTEVVEEEPLTVAANFPKNDPPTQLPDVNPDEVIRSEPQLVKENLFGDSKNNKHKKRR